MQQFAEYDLQISDVLLMELSENSVRKTISLHMPVWSQAFFPLSLIPHLLNLISIQSLTDTLSFSQSLNLSDPVS